MQNIYLGKNGQILSAVKAILSYKKSIKWFKKLFLFWNVLHYLDKSLIFILYYLKKKKIQLRINLKFIKNLNNS
jgi:hypothetical protein